jgi:hypothetical protein
MKSDSLIDVRITTMGETDPITVVTNSGVTVFKNFEQKPNSRNTFTLKTKGYSV